MHPILLNLAALTSMAQASVAPVPQATQPADATPFTMRSIPLGMTLAEFKKLQPIDDDGKGGMWTACSDFKPRLSWIDDASKPDEADGVVTCQWFRGEDSYPAFISLGDGSGPPVFSFINDGSGYKLFRIRFYANNEYASAILSGLTTRYGTPEETSSPVQNKAGATFTDTVSVWSNRASSITLEDRCGRVDRYCLIYRHTGLYREYEKILATRAAAAAAKL